MSSTRSALEAVDRILNRGADADEVLRQVVATLHERAGYGWAGIFFVEDGALVLGPAAGEPDEERRTAVPVTWQGERVAELAVDGAPPADRPFLERVAASPVERPEGRVPVVAAHPQGGSWPPMRSPISDVRRPRRWAAAFISIVGIVNLVSALTPPNAERLHAVLDFMPLGVAEAATALVALAGLGLLILAGGIRRGQRLAWQLALGLLTVSVLLHLAKGIDLEEAVVGFGAAGFLLVKRGAFRARVQDGHP